MGKVRFLYVQLTEIDQSQNLPGVEIGERREGDDAGDHEPGHVGVPQDVVVVQAEVGGRQAGLAHVHLGTKGRSHGN